MRKSKPRAALDDDPFVARLAADVREGLSVRVKSIPCKYLYDDRGSRLFEAITREPEYYQTRTEEKILERIADDVARRVRPAELVELGSGAGRKVRLVLDALRRVGTLRSCALLDINEAFLRSSVEELGADYPEIDVHALHADFLEDLPVLGDGCRRLVLFLAGTIGNLPRKDVGPFLGRLAARMAEGDALLVGLDLVKEKSRLDAAYNDAAGVTAEFIRNVLVVLNRELGADFDPESFDYVAFYDETRALVDIRLRSRRAQCVKIPGAGLDVEFTAGEDVQIEISCKYTRASFEPLLLGTGLKPAAWYTDPDESFALILLAKT